MSSGAKGTRIRAWAGLISAAINIMLLAAQTPATEFAGLRLCNSLMGAGYSIVPAWVFLFATALTSVAAVVCSVPLVKQGSTADVWLGRIALGLG